MSTVYLTNVLLQMILLFSPFSLRMLPASSNSRGRFPSVPPRWDTPLGPASAGSDLGPRIESKARLGGGSRWRRGVNWTPPRVTGGCPRNQSCFECRVVCLFRIHFTSRCCGSLSYRGQVLKLVHIGLQIEPWFQTSS